VLARVERRRGECGVAETGSGGPQVNDLWVRVGIGAVGGDEARARLWRAREGSDEASGTELGACAWLLDETPLAVELLERMQRGPAESDGQVLQTLGWALFEIGRWDEAAVRFEQALTVARTWGQTTIEAAVRAGLAQLAAGRGDRAGADAQAVTAMRTLDPSVSAAVAVRARHAQSLAALAAGDHTAAWLHASRLVTDGGRPEHFHASYYALADLAEAGVRSGRRDLGRRLVDEVVAAPGAPSSARIRQLHGHAQALLAADTGTPGSAEEWFTRTAGDVRGETWPFERARLRLSHGRWLRRERRIAEAREPLELAAATFSRLGAAPWLAATQQELRATGVLRTESSTRLGALTPTEREIVRLAASGLTNRDIGERLFLSPRTVGSHLYRIFPKLGVTARNQLRDVLEP
jgi:ATP/maltotriose-dependent transcriptional regulator MalT